MNLLRRIVEAAASAAVAAALVSAGLALGASEHERVDRPAPHAQGIAEVEDYPRGGEPVFGDALLLDGRPARLALVELADPPEAVRDFYLESFERRGLDARAVGQDGAWTVSALSADGRSQLLVGILARPGRGSLLVPARLELASAAPGAWEPELEAARSGQAQGLQRVESAGGGRRILSWREPRLVPLAAATRVRDAFGRSGWTLVSWQPGLRCRAEFAQGHRRAWLFAVAPGAPEHGSTVVLQLARGG